MQVSARRKSGSAQNGSVVTVVCFAVVLLPAEVAAGWRDLCFFGDVIFVVVVGLCTAIVGGDVIALLIVVGDEVGLLE
jgi:hypothetical protein